MRLVVVHAASGVKYALNKTCGTAYVGLRQGRSGGEGRDKEKKMGLKTCKAPRRDRDLDMMSFIL